MFRHNLFHSALPHLFIAVILFTVVFYFERILINRAEKTTSISIAMYEDDEMEKDQKLEYQVSDPIYMSTIEELLLSESIILQIDANAFVSSLSKTDKIRLLSMLSVKLYEIERYSDVVNVLTATTLDERNKNNIQFIYAYSLSKIDKNKQAIEEYKALIERLPYHQVATLNLALLLKKTKQCDIAIPVFEHALEILSGSKKAKAYSASGDCYMETNQYQEAEWHYKKSIEYRPDSSITWARLANAYVAMQQHVEALDAFEKSIALDPNNLATALNKAKYQLRIYEISAAQTTLRNIKRFSKSYKTNELLAWAYIEDGARNKARKELNYLIANASSSKQLQRAKLLLLYVDKKYDELLALLKQHKRLTNELVYLRGLAYRRTGYFNNALRIFEQLESEPTYNFRAQLQQARIIRSRKQYDAAIEQFERLVALSPYANEIWFESALVQEKRHQYADALDKINQALKLEPDNKVYTITKARLLHSLDETTQSVALLKALLVKYPNNTRALKMLAMLSQQLNQPDDLLDIYTRLLKLAPDDIDISISLAEVQIKLGLQVDAQRTLKNIVALQPEHIHARYLLAVSHFESAEYQLALSVVEQILQLMHNNTDALTLKKRIISRINKEK